MNARLKMIIYIGAIIYFPLFYVLKIVFSFFHIVNFRDVIEFTVCDDVTLHKDYWSVACPLSPFSIQ